MLPDFVDSAGRGDGSYLHPAGAEVSRLVLCVFAGKKACRLAVFLSATERQDDRVLPNYVQKYWKLREIRTHYTGEYVDFTQKTRKSCQGSESYMLKNQVYTGSKRERMFSNMKEREMNSRKFTTTAFALIIVTILFTSLSGLAAASQDSVAYLAGVTWFDNNGNGIRENDEPVAPGIPVYMRPLGGEAGVAGGLVVFSDNEGLVDFGGLEYGDYQVQVDNGEPFTVTLSEANSTSTLELPVAPASHSTTIFLPMVIR